MGYSNITSRTDAQALIPEDVATGAIRKATDESAVLSAFRRIPVSRQQTRVPVLSALPTAYWVNGDVGLKQTTEMGWNNKYLNVEELAVIMPVPDNVVADMEVNVYDEAEPYIVEAMGRALDSAVFFGTNAPASFPTAILPSIVAAGNNVRGDIGSYAATAGGYFGAIDAAISLMEQDGFEPDAFIAATSAKGKLRAARNSQGDRLDAGRLSPNLGEFDGSPVSYAMKGLWPVGGTGSSYPEFIAIEKDQFVVGVRSDITLKVLTEAVIQDASGAIIYNLAQQDMTALRFTFRVGWQVANIINHDQPTESLRYPAAAVTL